MEPFDIADVGWLMICAIGLAQAVFVLLLFRGEGKRAFRANRWLGAFVLAVGFSFFNSMAYILLDLRWNLYLVPFFGALPFTYLPSIYMYFRELSGRPVRRPVLHYLLPVVAVFVLGLVVAVQLRDFGPLLDDVRPDIDADVFESPLQGVLTLSIIAGLHIQLVTYLIWIWRITLRYMRKISEQLDGEQPGLRRWLTEFVLAISAIFVLYTIITILALLQIESDWLYAAMDCCFVLVFFRLSHLIAVNPSLFVADDYLEDGQGADTGTMQAVIAANRTGTPSPAQQGDDAKDPPRATIDPDEVERICRALEKLVAQTDMLFDPLLTMPKMAAAVGTKPNQLSMVLNRHIGKSFFDYVNEYRIEEATRLLMKEPDRTILDIAVEVGFNSKSTFNLAFKKITGHTPSSYRQMKPAISKA
ncbi:AraC family transcriptional regulator [Thalassospira marina]|uniref:AraC family transcriptional regulator n=1 Tax=Thalassospira marina TaxID=2048283 RepID=A0ABM6QAS0_9PROT|nr:helix-turn-helix domain-containing protein [Thalassospira marina]AUG53668.1 AraC family transcriptional regulator [Thalassospira marina]